MRALFQLKLRKMKVPKYRNDITDGEYYGEESGEPQSELNLIIYNMLLQGWPSLLDLRRRVAGATARCVRHPECWTEVENGLRSKKRKSDTRRLREFRMGLGRGDGIIYANSSGAETARARARARGLARGGKRTPLRIADVTHF